MDEPVQTAVLFWAPRMGEQSMVRAVQEMPEVRAMVEMVEREKMKPVMFIALACCGGITETMAVSERIREHCPVVMVVGEDQPLQLPPSNALVFQIRNDYENMVQLELPEPIRHTFSDPPALIGRPAVSRPTLRRRCARAYRYRCTARSETANLLW